jgi:copper(I)-binding protein
MTSRPLACLLAGLLLTAEVHATAAHVRATDAWIRVLPGALPAGGYLTLHNDGNQAATLTSASSAAYARIMLHRSSMTGRMSRMTMVDALTVPAHGTVTLAPGGYHFMLMQATAPVQPGDKLVLTLKFADGSSLPVAFVARPANALDAGPTPPVH